MPLTTGNITGSSVTGNITGTGQEVTVEWEIDDFSTFSDETDRRHLSTAFSALNSFWRFAIYPNGETRNESVGWVSLYLLSTNFSCSPVNLTFQFNLKEPKNVKFTVHPATEMLKKSRGMGFKKLVSRSDLLRLMRPVKLVVSCRLACAHHVTLEGTSSLWNLYQDLKAIQTEEKYSDYTVKVEGRKFYCHRAILARRSEYFSTLFNTDMAEKRRNEVKFEDMEASVFEFVLSYMYCRDIAGISEQNVCKIYMASDKLLMEELKKTCAEYIKEHLGSDIICDVLCIAKMHGDEELEKCALDYFTQHSDDVLQSQVWKEFKREQNLEFVNEVLEKALKKAAVGRICRDPPVNDWAALVNDWSSNSDCWSIQGSYGSYKS